MTENFQKLGDGETRQTLKESLPANAVFSSFEMHNYVH